MQYIPVKQYICS